MGPPLEHELELVVVEVVSDTDVSRSHCVLSPLLLLLDGEVGDPGSSDEVEQVLASTWSAREFDDLSLIEFDSAERYELLDLVEEYDEDPQSLGMLSSDKLEGKLGTPE